MFMLSRSWVDTMLIFTTFLVWWLWAPYVVSSALDTRTGLAFCSSKAVREVMEKQRATEILMEALCLSVPYDPAFVLEVHKDVLKSRLRCAGL